MRLNLGAGGQSREGWVSLDRAGNVDVVHDLTTLPLPFDDASCEAAVAHHVLDQLTRQEILDLLGDLYRVLQPGAIVRVSCPDLEAGIDAAVAGVRDWFPERCASAEQSLGWFVTQGGARKTYLNPQRLRMLSELAGFSWFALLDRGEKTLGQDWLCDFDGRHDESFFVEFAK